jgi:hypothetical protein
MGERVLDALKLLERMSSNMEKFATSEELDRHLRSLVNSLQSIRDVVKTFGWKGWMRRTLETCMKQGSMSALNKKLGEDLDRLLRLYEMERDGALLESKNRHCSAHVPVGG